MMKGFVRIWGKQVDVRCRDAVRDVVATARAARQSAWRNMQDRQD